MKLRDAHDQSNEQTSETDHIDMAHAMACAVVMIVQIATPTFQSNYIL